MSGLSKWIISGQDDSLLSDQSSKLSDRQSFFGHWHPSYNPALHTYIVQSLLTPTYLRHWTSPGFKTGQSELYLVIPNCHLEAISISWLAHPERKPNLGQELYSTVLIIQRFSFIFCANLARIIQQVIVILVVIIRFVLNCFSLLLPSARYLDTRVSSKTEIATHTTQIYYHSHHWLV